MDSPLVDLWPLFGLEIRSPRLVLTPVRDEHLPGLVAAGDITGTPYQYVKAAGEGNVAALSAVSYLDQNK